MKFSTAIFASAVAALAAAPSATAFAPAVSQVHKTAAAAAGVASLPAATKLFMSDEVGFDIQLFACWTAPSWVVHMRI